MKALNLSRSGGEGGLVLFLYICFINIGCSVEVKRGLYYTVQILLMEEYKLGLNCAKLG